MKSEDVEKIVGERFLRSIAEFRESGKKEQENNIVHVTELVHECPRYPYYNRCLNKQIMDLTGFLKTSYGRMVHTVTKMSDMHELEVKMVTASGTVISGTIDEVLNIDGVYVIVDKKTTRTAIKNAYNHHWKQVDYYAVLLEKSKGITARYGALCYINLAEVGEPKVFVKQIRNIGLIEQDLVARANAIAMALRERKLPECNRYWLCKYCNFSNYCVRNKGLEEE